MKNGNKLLENARSLRLFSVNRREWDKLLTKSCSSVLNVETPVKTCSGLILGDAAIDLVAFSTLLRRWITRIYTASRLVWSEGTCAGLPDWRRGSVVCAM